MAGAFVYIVKDHHPVENFAFEEALFWGHAPDETVLILWVNAPSVIIGRNQNPWQEVHLKHLLADGVPIIRRISGGGSVYHDFGNVNFTFIEAEKSYDLGRHFTLIMDAMKTFGIQLTRNDRDDLLLSSRKVSGNAFYFRGKKRLHHGTLLIDTDRVALWRYLVPEALPIEAKSIPSKRSDVANLKTACEALDAQKVIEALEAAFVRMYPNAIAQRGSLDTLLPEAYRQTYETAVDRYRSWSWTFGETPKFSYHFDASSYVLIDGGRVVERYGKTSIPPLEKLRN